MAELQKEAGKPAGAEDGAGVAKTIRELAKKSEGLAPAEAAQASLAACDSSIRSIGGCDRTANRLAGLYA